MASVNLSGTLTNPEGEPDEGAIVKFTLLTTTGNTVSSSKSQLEVPQDGLYDIDIVYGNLRVDYINEDGSTRFVAIVTVNGDTVATSLPELLNAVVPPTDAQLLEFQGILADAVTAKTGAELAETGAVAAEAGAVAAAADIVNIRRETVHNTTTLSEAVAATGIAVGDAINLAERTAGNGGGAVWDVVLASGVTANTFNIVACTGFPTLALVLRVGDVSIRQFGGINNGESTNSINAALSYAKNNNKKVIVDGIFNHSGQILFHTFSTVHGFGVDNTGFVYTGLNSTWAAAFVGGVGQRVSLKDFFFRGDGTRNELLADFTGLRYSTLENLAFASCRVCMRLDMSWGNVFKACSWKAGDDTGVFPLNSIGIEMVPGAINATSFIGCIISINTTGVDAQGMGRNVVFNGGCTFEGNNIGVLLSGTGSSKVCLFEGNYWEANVTHNVFLERALGARDDEIIFRNNYVYITPNMFAGFITVSGTPAGGLSNIVLQDNCIEQLVVNSNAINNYVIFFSHASVNINLTYESRIPVRTIGAGAIKMEHFNVANIDFKFFDSNIPIEPSYVNNAVAPNNLFGPRVANEKLRVRVSNGQATITGSVVDAGNVFAGWLKVADLPFSLSSPSGQYPLVGAQLAGNNNIVPVGVRVIGTGVEVFFSAATDYVIIDGSWGMAGGSLP